MHKSGYKLKLYRGAWAVYWREETESGQSIPRRSSLRTGDKAEAERRFQDFLKSASTPAETVAEIYQAYLDEKKDTPGHDVAEWGWKALAPTFLNLRPDQVTRETCRSHIDRRRKVGIKDGTIHRELTILRAAIRWHNPKSPAQFEMPAKPAPNDRYLTRAEYGQLLAGASAPHVRLFIALALSTAARATAILELTWDRIDFERGLIYLSKGIEVKNKRRATVPMTGFARSELETAYEARLSDYVIEYAGEPIKAIKKGVYRAAERAGLKDVSPHVLRHTAAVWMAEGRVPMSEISQYLGHKNTNTTERVYARYSPDYLRGAASKLEFDPVIQKNKTPPPTARKSQKKAIGA